MYHVTDFKKYERCQRMFWLSRKERKQMIPFVNYNMSMIELCKELLMIQDPFEGAANDDGALALAALSTHAWLLNARFAHEDLRVKIPIMYQEDGKRIVYFTYSSCYPKEGEAQKMADTLSVLELLGIFIDEVYVIHLNPDYVRGEQLDVRALLIITEHLYNSKNHEGKLIKDLIASHRRDILPLLEDLRSCEAREDVAIVRSNACTRGVKCPYFDECFPEKPDHTSILNLVQSCHKYAMKEEGIEDIKDVNVERIEGTRHQYAQIMAAKYGRYVDQAALRCWLKEHIHYPISYLDFEWETYAYPPYKGLKPFDVVCFEYSLHVEQANQKDLTHHCFIETGDCRIAFIESLLKHVPATGTILVYNMEGAEKLRLKQLAEQFPQYASQLESIWERMVDLSLPFSTGNVYDNRMAGFYSLKTLVPIFSDYNYQDLDISYGMDAVEKYRELSQCDEADAKVIREQLDAYCSMDTYAEYIVYHALDKIAWES